MKRLFQKWLLVFVAGAFLLTFGISWWIHSSLARESALELLRIKLDDAARQVEHTQKNLETVIQMSNSAALSKAHALAQMIALDPDVLKRRDELEKIRRNLDIDQLHVSDENGILVTCIPQSYEGYDMADSRQSAEFLGALNDRDFELVQAPTPNGIQKILFQYAGVARKDSSGIVQIGYRPERIEEAMKIADVQSIASTFRIGHAGKLRIAENGNPEDRRERVFHKAVDGTPSLCLTIPCGNYLLTGTLPEEEMYLSRNSVLRILVIANLVLFGVIFLLVSCLLQKVVIKGIYSVNSSLREITNGNLEEKIAVSTTSEFQALSRGINTTVEALKKSIENEAKRIDAELEMGRTIQNSVLPVDFPDQECYRLAAGMYAAREVGGDFYDFFPIDDRHIAVLIADVSGKGITAALYMMNSKALLKELIQSGMDPAEAFDQANRELCRNNKAHMFLSAFLGVLDLSTGILTCVSAGHNPPLLKHAHGNWEFLRVKHSIVLGVTTKKTYTGVSIELRPGDRLFLYTDGVTEAKNSNNELFGDARLREALDSMRGTPSELINELKTTLERFAAGEPQSDDITMLILDYFQSGQP